MSVKLEIHGGYNNTGNFNNVVLCGSPNNTGFGGVPLTQAHQNGVGTGLTFDGNREKFSLDFNLVGIATDDNANYQPNQHYVHYGGTYNWYLDLQYSADGGNSWNNLLNHLEIFIHDASQDWDLCYANSWLRTAQNSHYYRDNLSVPPNTTHLRISISGENPTQTTWVVYPFSTLIPTYKPMAIRKNGIFKTLNVESGKISIRKGGVWQDISNEQNDSVGTVAGHNRIRKNNQFLQQGKAGN